MAKKSMIEREKKREALVKKYAAKRAALKADGRAFPRLPEAGKTASQLQRCASAQPLPADRPSTRLLP